jgi:manganese transport protein
LAGQIVMEGFIHLKLPPWLRRMITRSIAIVPTIIVVWFTGERGTEKLLLLSQVILSLQLSFAVVPLVIFTGSRKVMGEFVNGRGMQALAWLVAALIAGLNAWFLVLMLR